VLTEVDSLRKQLSELEQKVSEKDSAIKSALVDAETVISKIETKPADRSESQRDSA
jgi:cell division septum initiation protein DivIVA